jgi:class 3 adenylate cyclase
MVEGRDTRIGLAVAEVAVDGGPVSGLKVDLAVRLGSVAAPGQLLLTTFARVLVAGSGIELETVDDPVARLPDGLPPCRVVTS